MSGNSASSSRSRPVLPRRSERLKNRTTVPSYARLETRSAAGTRKRKRKSASANPKKKPPSTRRNSEGEPSKEGGATCSICLDAENMDEFEFVSCGHRFHVGCLAAWVSKKRECPLCRNPIDVPAPSSSSSTRRPDSEQGYLSVSVLVASKNNQMSGNSASSSRSRPVSSRRSEKPNSRTTVPSYTRPGTPIAAGTQKRKYRKRQRKDTEVKCVSANPEKKPRLRTPPSTLRNSKSKSSKEGDASCSICLDAENMDEFEFVPCGHRFHVRCLAAWVSNKRQCPLCRNPIDVPTPSTSRRRHPDSPGVFRRIFLNFDLIHIL